MLYLFNLIAYVLFIQTEHFTMNGQIDNNRPLRLMSVTVSLLKVTTVVLNKSMLPKMTKANDMSRVSLAHSISMNTSKEITF